MAVGFLCMQCLAMSLTTACEIFRIGDSLHPRRHETCLNAITRIPYSHAASRLYMALREVSLWPIRSWEKCNCGRNWLASHWSWVRRTEAACRWMTSRPGSRNKAAAKFPQFGPARPLLSKELVSSRRCTGVPARFG